MRYAQLGKLASAGSLTALLAIAGMSSAQAAPIVQTSASLNVQMTPHIFENTTITEQPPGPEESGLCGEAGLVPIMPADTIQYHYELRRDRVNAVANPGFAFDPALKLQTEWILNPAYFSCPNPDMFIVHAIDEPWFDDLCGTENDVIHLPADTDKYRYFIIGNEVVATETADHIFQQDIVHAFPILLTDTPCEVTPPSADQTPVSVGTLPLSEATQPEAPAVPISETPVSAEQAPIAPAEVSAEAMAESVPVSEAKLADTGLDGVLWFWFGIGLMAVAIGGMMFRGSRGRLARR